MKEVSSIPIFPLNLVLMPGNTLPLHIFEEKYKEMIKYCLDEEIDFGIVYSDRKEIKKVGCTAMISNVLKEYDDGRMDILTRGSQRFHLQNLSDEDSFLQASVDYFDDEDEPETPEMVEIAHRGMRLLSEISKINNLKENYNELQGLNLRVISFLLANAPGIPDQHKQNSLEMKLTSERLLESVNKLEEVLKNMKLISQIKKAAIIPDNEYGFYTN